jgi:hypothetical protein
MTCRGHRIILLLTVLAAFPVAAQTSDQRIQQLEKRLEDLTSQIDQIRTELAQIKGQPVAPSPEQDLTKIDIAPTAPPPPAPTAAPALTDVQTVANVQNPGASKVFNPDTSVIGNFIGKAGRRNPYEFGDSGARPPLSLDEAEVAFEAFIDPYAKGRFFLSVTPEGIDVEEGYANFVALPHDFTAKVGKMKALFGKDNTWHTHIRPWADQPLVVHNFFGDEGLSDSGVSVSKTINNPWNTFVEVTGEAFSGDVDGVFARRRQSDLFYNGHIKAFRDITENSNLEVGASYASGSRADAESGRSQFGGIDVTYRWKPLQQGLYRGLIARFEGLTNDRSGFDRNLRGFYTSLDYQVARRWFAGVRLDSADRVVDFDAFRDRGASATLTFWPSEFSQVRGQLRRTRYGDVQKSITEFLLQLQFSIGAHGAHTF